MSAWTSAHFDEIAANSEVLAPGIVIAQMQTEIKTLRRVLSILLDNVDYTVGNCLPYEPIDAVLTVETLNCVKEALK